MVTFLGVPIIRAIVFKGLYWGPLFWETAKMSYGVYKKSVGRQVFRIHFYAGYIMFGGWYGGDPCFVKGRI